MHEIAERPPYFPAPVGQQPLPLSVCVTGIVASEIAGTQYLVEKERSLPGVRHTLHQAIFEGEHFLNGQVLSHVVLPLVEGILVHS